MRALKETIILNIIFSLFFIYNKAFSTDYPPKDHQGADLILQNGDKIWGKHFNINRFEIPSTTTVSVILYYPKGDSNCKEGNGFAEIYANEIDVKGVLIAKGIGYCGGSGRGGTGGWGLFPGQDSGMSMGRYQLFADGPAKGNLLGEDGGYNITGGNSDTSIDASVLMGSGGEGGEGGEGGDTIDGGGGGGGGGYIILCSKKSINLSGIITTSGRTGRNGGPGGDGKDAGGMPAGGDGGWGGSSSYLYSYDEGLGSPGGKGYNEGTTSGEDGTSGKNGGAGGGGAILLICDSPSSMTITGTLDARGGRDQIQNGGTVKIFYKGDQPTSGTIYSPRIYYRNLDLLPLKPTYWFFH